MGGTQLMLVIPDASVCSTCLCIHMNLVVPGDTTGTRSGMMFMNFLQQPGLGPGSGRRWSRWAGEKHTETPPDPDLRVGRESDLESDLGSSSFPVPLLLCDRSMGSPHPWSLVHKVHVPEPGHCTRFTFQMSLLVPGPCKRSALVSPTFLLLR